MTKNEIRKAYLEKRNTLNAEFIQIASQKMTDDILNDAHYKECKILYAYFPVRNEINTELLIAHALNDNKIVAVPICLTSNDMVFQRIDSAQSFHNNRYNIMEPSYNPHFVIDGPGLMIVPLVAYHENMRIGFGKHYYDNYLSNRSYIYTIGVAYKFQETKENFDSLDSDIPLREIRSY